MTEKTQLYSISVLTRGKGLFCRLMSLLLLVIGLTACGYHLRGSMDIPKELQKIYLQGGSSKLRDQFKKALESSSGQLVSTPEAAAMVVRVVEGEIKQRGVSLSAGGRTNEFELYYRLEYELRDAAGKVLVAQEPLEIRREYFNDQQDIIAKDNEEGVIRTEMYQQAVRTIFARMRIALANKPK